MDRQTDWQDIKGESGSSSLEIDETRHWRSVRIFGNSSTWIGSANEECYRNQNSVDWKRAGRAWGSGAEKVGSVTQTFQNPTLIPLHIIFKHTYDHEMTAGPSSCLTAADIMVKTSFVFLLKWSGCRKWGMIDDSSDYIKKFSLPRGPGFVLLIQGHASGLMRAVSK